MKNVYINTKYFSSGSELHRYLAEELDFPDYYGNNLAALFDCLTDLSEEVKIYYTGEEFADEEMQLYFQRVLQVFLDGEEENEFLTIVRVS